MDGFFSIKGKEAALVSGILGIFIYYIFMGGEDGQNKFYFILLGYGVWVIIKNIYWYYREAKIIDISKYDVYRSYEELNKIRKFDENRADKIEDMIINGNR